MVMHVPAPKWDAELQIGNLSMSRQAAKIMALVLNPKTERVPKKAAFTMLGSMGFVLSTKGTHHNWRHPNGARFTTNQTDEKDFWGYTLSQLRASLKQLGLVVPKNEYDLPPGVEELLDTMSEKAIEEIQKEPEMTLTKEQSDRLKQLEIYAIGLEAKINEQNINLQAMGDLLVEISTKLDNLQNAPKGGSDSKISALKQKIEQAIEENPKFKEDARIIASIAGTTPAKVKAYFEGRLE